MLTRRVIACLDVTDGRVVKGVQFRELRDAGAPEELAAKHAAGGADEIVLLDIGATHEKRGTLLEAVRRAAQAIFIPLTVGGGVRCLRDAEAIFAAGADKITINSAAVENPALITEVAERYGSQAIVVAVDAKRGESGAEVFTGGGRLATGKQALEWIREAESRGAGEILLTSMDRDGTRKGFDCELTAAAAKAVRIPVIASGGAGSAADFVEVFLEGCADAALAASILHFEIESIGAIKVELARAGVPVRWPC